MAVLENKHYHPALCLILSWLLPGLGQIILGQTRKGVMILVLSFLGSALGCLPGVLIVIPQLIDAYQIASAVERGDAVDEDAYSNDLLFKIAKILHTEATLHPC